MKAGLILLGLVAILVAALAAALTFGGPAQPAPMASIGTPFKGVDFSGMPAPNRFTARDGHALSYREYSPVGEAARGSVILVHGSSARSESMHPMARGLARAGYTVYALDVRGHSTPDPKGQIGYVGQLEDDLEDFLKSVQPTAPRTLIGFSAGGGFALRFASDPRKALFDRYLLLSPFLHQNAPTDRPGTGGWVSIGLPRIVALALLDRAGITRFHTLPVTAFALDDNARTFLTPQYAFNLALNFRPRNDWRADIAAATQPMEVLAGRDDEVFFADRFEDAFADAGRPVVVTLVPGVGHIDMSLKPAAIDAVVLALQRLASPNPK